MKPLDQALAEVLDIWLAVLGWAGAVVAVALAVPVIFVFVYFGARAVGALLRGDWLRL